MGPGERSAIRRRRKPSRILEVALVGMLAGVLGAGIRGCGTSPTPRAGGPGLTGFGSLTGRVYDEGDGRGLPGALVEVVSAGVSLAVTAAADGSYTLEDIPSGPHRLRASHPGFFRREVSLFVSAGAAEGRDLTLERVLSRGALDAIVRQAPDGPALANVAVEVIETGARTVSSATGRVFLPDLPSGSVRLRLELVGHAPRVVVVEVRAGQVVAPALRLEKTSGFLVGVVRGQPPLTPLTNALVSLPGLEIQTLTNAAGAYILPDVPAEVPFDVMFSEPSHESLLVTTSHGIGRGTTLNVTLSRGFGEVVGTVRQFMGPNLPGAVVSIPRFALSTVTDGAGGYRFPRVPASLVVSIGAAAANHVQDGQLITIPPGAVVAQDFDLIPLTGSIAGTVRSTSANAPVPGVLVELPNLFVSTGTDAAGNYVFLDLPSGQQLARFTAVGFTTLTTFLTIDPGVTNPGDQRLGDI